MGRADGRPRMMRTQQRLHSIAGSAARQERGWNAACARATALSRAGIATGQVSPQVLRPQALLERRRPA